MIYTGEQLRMELIENGYKVNHLVNVMNGEICDEVQFVKGIHVLVFETIKDENENRVYKLIYNDMGF